MIALAAVLPIAAMIGCMDVNAAAFCWDAKKELRICIDGECRTPADLSRSWRHHPEKQKRDYNKLYGAKP